MCFGTHRNTCKSLFFTGRDANNQKHLQKCHLGLGEKTKVAFNNLKRGASAHSKVNSTLSQVCTALLAVCCAHSQQHFVQPGSCHARNLVTFKYAKSPLVHGTLRQSLAICACHAFYVCSGNSSSQKRLEDEDATFLWDQLGL